jgi:hypothetical protein
MEVSGYLSIGRKTDREDLTSYLIDVFESNPNYRVRLNISGGDAVFSMLGKVLVDVSKRIGVPIVIQPQVVKMRNKEGQDFSLTKFDIISVGGSDNDHGVWQLG